MAAPLTLLLVLFGCSDSPDTPESPVPETIDQLPVLTVSSPERGAFYGTEELRIQGTAFAGASDLSSLVSNGIEINLDAGGGFSQILPTEIGLNLVGTRLEDFAGKRAVDGRAFYWGEAYFPGDFVQEGLRMRLGPELLDDDDPDLDDAASLIELAAADPAIADLVVGTEIEDDNFDFILTGLSLDSASVDITPNNGFLTIEAELRDFWLGFDIENILGQSYLNTIGEAEADTVSLQMDVSLSMTNGSLESSATQATTSLSGFAITVDYFPDFLEGYLADWTQDYIQDVASETIQEVVGDLLKDFIEGLTADTSVSGVDLFTTLDTVEIAETGIRLTADVSAIGADLSSLPPNASSPKTPSTVPSWEDLPEAPVALAVDDDMINQVLFSLWSTGSLSGIEFSGTELALLAGAPIEAPLGPVTSASLNAELPPMMRTSVSPEMTADMGIGELRLQVAREDGILHDFSISAWLGIQAALTESKTVAVELDNRPRYIPMEIGVLEWDPELDPGDLAALIRLMMPPLFGRAGSLAPSLEVPTVPLGDALGLEALDDILIGLREAQFAFNEDNWLVLGGSLEASQ